MPKSRSTDSSLVDTTSDEPASLEPVITTSTVRHKAVELLARREHSRAELRDKLATRRYPSDLIELVLDQLAERDLQCDVRFAESYTRMRVNRGYGGNKIRAELQTRSLSREVIDDALAVYEADWVDNAIAALQKKYTGSQVAPGTAKELARMQRFLWSRGYNSADIKTALKTTRQTVE